MLKNEIGIYRLTLGLGVLVMAVSLTVLLGWALHEPALIQIHPSFAPMQINTALSFLLLSIAMFCTLKDKRRIMLVLASIVALIAAATLFEYLADVNLGIDQFFTDYAITTQTLHLGRMAPNTTLCFLVLSLVFMGYFFSEGILPFLILQLASYVTFFIGMTAVAGYIFNLPYAYGWGIYTKMALHTAFSFMALSLGMSWTFVLRKKYLMRMEKLLPPLVVFTATAFIFLLIWNALLSFEITAIRTNVKNVGSQVVQDIQITLKSQFSALSRMASRWENAGGTPKEEWMDDAKAYYDDFKGYRAIEWIDKDYRIRWIQPLFGNEVAQDYDLSTIPARKVIMDEARDTNHLVAMGPVDLVQGSSGMVVFAPIRTQKGFDGFIAGIFDVNALFNEILSQSFYEHFSIELSLIDRDQVFYRTHTPQNGLLNDFEIRQIVSVLDNEWLMTIRPSEELVDAFQTITPAITLLAGLLISLVIAVTWYYVMENAYLVKQSRLFLDSAQAGLLRASLLGHCEEANSQLCILFGSTRDNILRVGWLAYVDPLYQEKVTLDWHDAIAHHKDYAADFKIIRADGTPVWVQCYASVYLNDHFEAQAYIMTFYNIDSLKQTELKLKDLSYRDELTDLPNRRYFIEVLKNTLGESLRYRRKFTLIYIDIDYFKQINDGFGHAAGDELLKELGKRFKQLIRGTDFIARLSGDEFCLIMREASSAEAIGVMTSRLMGMMKVPIKIGNSDHVVTLSMGVVIYANESITYEELLERADAALYKAKAAGRNHVQFYG